MYTVRIGYEGYEVTLYFRDEKTARGEYDLALSAFAEAEATTLKDGFKREARVDFSDAVSVVIIDEEAAAMALAEVQKHAARATMKAQKDLASEMPGRGIQVPSGLMRNQ